ncbi:unnamed protein product [Discosporangium mesarthrocarpum]
MHGCTIPTPPITCNTSPARAYLFDNVVNVTTGPSVKRGLRTGMHTVSDIYCTDCQTLLGWRYDDAVEQEEKYKVGKFVLEKAKISKFSWTT